MDSLRIGKHIVGNGQPCFIIAEAGVNHNGDLDLAKQLVTAAAESGANAVKFQTFNADRLVNVHAPKAKYQQKSAPNDESQLAMLKKLEISEEDHLEIKAHCDRSGITFLSSPFDEISSDFLESMGISAYKIPSGEITNLPFLAHVARKGLPMIVSTGMATLGETESAVSTIEVNGNPGIILLHCVSNYPADPRDVNLRAMITLRWAFNVPTGFSDHTEGDEIALAAVSLGGCILEKHFTMSRKLPGPDHQASIEPDELARLVRRIRAVESAMGDGRKIPAVSEAETAAVARKSLFARCDIPEGSVIKLDMVQIKRPGTGISPSRIQDLLGRTANTRIEADALLQWDMFF